MLNKAHFLKTLEGADLGRYDGRADNLTAIYEKQIEKASLAKTSFSVFECMSDSFVYGFLQGKKAGKASQ